MLTSSALPRYQCVVSATRVTLEMFSYLQYGIALQPFGITVVAPKPTLMSQPWRSRMWAWTRTARAAAAPPPPRGCRAPGVDATRPAAHQVTPNSWYVMIGVVVVNGALIAWIEAPHNSAEYGSAGSAAAWQRDAGKAAATTLFHGLFYSARFWAVRGPQQPRTLAGRLMYMTSSFGIILWFFFFQARPGISLGGRRRRCRASRMRRVPVAMRGRVTSWRTARTGPR